MSDQPSPVIITLPAEIDLTNAEDVLEMITAACAPGVTVVIADLTGTTFCDSSGLQHLIQAAHPAQRAPRRSCSESLGRDQAGNDLVSLTGDGLVEQPDGQAVTARSMAAFGLPEYVAGLTRGSRGEGESHFFREGGEDPARSCPLQVV